MDFSVFKRIQGFCPGYQQPRSNVHSFSAYPSKDFVNPGIAAIQLYSYIVPLHGKPYTTVEKKILIPPEIDPELVKNLEGEGEGQDKGQGEPSSSSETLNQNERQNILDNLNESVKQKLAPDVYKTLLKPGKIKTGKLVINNDEPGPTKRKLEATTPITEKKAKSNAVNHKFQFF